MKKLLLKNRKAQLVLGTGLTILLLILIIFWLKLVAISLWYLLLFPVIFSLVQFCLTPLLRGLGIFHYYSHFLMANTSDTTTLDLHTGTTFDFVLHFSINDSGSRSRNFIITEILNGLLRIIHEIENGTIQSNQKIVAAPYFISQRTIYKFGFKEKAPSFLDRIFIVGSFFDILLMYSFTKNRLTFPNIFQMKIVEMSAEELITKKDYLRKVRKNFDELFTTPACRKGRDYSD